MSMVKLSSEVVYSLKFVIGRKHLCNFPYTSWKILAESVTIDQRRSTSSLNSETEAERNITNREHSLYPKTYRGHHAKHIKQRCKNDTFNISIRIMSKGCLGDQFSSIGG